MNGEGRMNGKINRWITFNLMNTRGSKATGLKDYRSAENTQMDMISINSSSCERIRGATGMKTRTSNENSRQREAY